MTFDEALGAEIRAARVRARMRQVDLAERVQITQSKLSKIENGKESPSVATLVLIGLATDRDPASLLPLPYAYALAATRPEVA
jgi:transcriptional regulator with XRE-family HTH domain